MSFLAPLFLAGLAALAIPVLIHLIQKERKNVVVFPSLMFLKRVPYESVRRRRIHNWALLIMRLTALALIVAAFSRPFLRGASVAAAGEGAREVIVLLDRSYSMGLAGQWDRARTAAANAVNGLGSLDRASLVLFDTGAELAVRATEDRARLLSEIRATEPSARATRYGPALKLAGSLLAESTMPRREVVLISDFQRNGWNAADGVRLPDGTVVTPISVAVDGARNVAVTPATFQRERFQEQDRVIVTAGTINRSAEAVANLDVHLEIDGRAVQTSRVSMDPAGAASTVFQPVTLTSQHTRVSVRIGEDALARDNAFHFVLSPPRPVTVALVSRDPALYLARALAIGQTPQMQVTSTRIEDLSDEMLSRTQVVMLNDVALSDSVAARLKRYVEAGGGLFVIAGQQGLGSANPAELLPATAVGTVDRTQGPAGTLGGLSYGHAIFEPFRAPRSGDFSTTRFYTYRRLTPAADAQVLARFDDGNPALIDRAVGRGHVVLWASTVDMVWSDLPLKPVFLPFIHQVARHLSRYREWPAWSHVGHVIDLGDAVRRAPGRERAGARAERLVALTPAGQRVNLDDPQRQVLELAEQGFYEVRPASAQGDPLLVAASNVELTESDQTAADPQEIVAAVTAGPGKPGGTDGPLALPDEAQERSQRLWWYLLFAGILLLTAESLMAHRLSRAA